MTTTPRTEFTPSAGHALDTASLRELFPVLRRQINGKPLVYLDSAASSQKPQSVIDALYQYDTEHHSNVHRGVHTLSQQATQLFEQTRDRMRKRINAADRSEIIFTRGTTEGINLIAQAFARPTLKPGDEILITHMEHHSNIVPWQIVCEQTGATLRVAPVTDAGEVDLDAFENLISEQTRIVSFVHVSNALGTINPIHQLTGLAKRAGATVVIDGAQAMPHQRIDVQDIGCDFYACSGHKMFGPTGVGVLYGRGDLLENMPPYHGGGEMIKSVSFDGTIYDDPPRRFEAGTPNIAGVVGLGAAIEFLESVDFEALHRAEQDLLHYATQRIKELNGITIIGTASHKAPVISFTMDAAHPHDIGTILDQQGIAIRTGHHCTQPLMERFGIPATARASMALYNTRRDIDALIEALRQVNEVFA